MLSGSDLTPISDETENTQIRIALLNASDSTASQVVANVDSSNIQVEVVPSTVAAAFSKVADRFSIVLIDAITEPATALSFCVRLGTVKRPSFRVVLMIGREDVETARLGFAAGAMDVITESPDQELFRLRVRAIARSRIESVKKLEPILSERDDWVRKSLLPAHERGQLELHYQPRFDVNGTRITSMEALARWYPPGAPPVPPSVFIPIAEQIGAIGLIGSDFLRRACREAKRWDDEGFPGVTVSINASVRQFETGQLFQSVTDALIDSGLSPQSLEIEVTESLLIEAVSFVDEALHELKSIGVRIALDDFGTGYSSLRCLTTIPLDVLKLDRSIVLGVGEDVQVDRVVSAICALARDLGLRTVAEGVDAESMLEGLREAGCDEIQGFLFASAMAPDQALEFLKGTNESRKPEAEPFS